MKKILLNLILLVVLTIPAFSLLIRPGIHSMHDFHPFRLKEIINCISDKIIPCRWAANAGAGFGEPVFNYYGQFPYWMGSLFYFGGFSILNSTKILFILSLILSACFMFMLSQKYFGTSGGMLSALFYIYAPYRAVDVWVRGALPEAFAFIFFPLILLFPNIFWLSLAVAGLLITHNLSALMFLPFALIFAFLTKNLRKFLVSLFISIFLAAFYLIPVYWEKNLVTISEFTQNLYQYQIHFTTINQLFISRFWGFGSSVWGTNDNLSFSAGHLHWIIGFLVIFISISKKNRIGLFSSLLGFFALYLTHGKSEVFWKLFPLLSYLQFPWRFLSISTFFLSLSAGALMLLKPKKIIISTFLLLLILLNYNFFKSDQWITQSDQQYFSGNFWDTQRFASIVDYWPKDSVIPNTIAPDKPYFVIGEGVINYYLRKSSSAEATVTAQSESLLEFPIVYFPLWHAKINNQSVPVVKHGENKLIALRIPSGKSQIKLNFNDTLPRITGNLISLISLIILVLFKFYKDEKYFND